MFSDNCFLPNYSRLNKSLWSLESLESQDRAILRAYHIGFIMAFWCDTNYNVNSKIASFEKNCLRIIKIVELPSRLTLEHFRNNEIFEIRTLSKNDIIINPPNVAEQS